MFSSSSEEYIENGLYNIDGIEFYSIWTFKNKFNIANNTNSQNKEDASKIPGFFHQSKPDFGPFSSIKLFPANELKKFYFKQ